jgi:anti-sigma regulatory factor (Ser/Thr protein kinase)
VIGTWSRLFFGRTDQVREARRFVHALLEGSVESVECETAEQIVSALATNAIVHTSSGQADGWFIVHVVLFADRVRLRVFDQGSTTRKPEVLTPTAEDETGRGLAIVAELAAEWDVVGDETGRIVWADIKGLPPAAR